MLLSSVNAVGFKSFAEKTTIKFGKGITAIVGPNGSGKSNINDAVRWVLGEQSTKNLRGKSMEDVIFSGTQNRRPHGYCEVTINIDNKDRSLNFDSDIVSVTRRFYRSHESEYLINNNIVRLRDVHELFMDTGLGRDGYSMIGQGKIDSIISSKSDERRDIFEEAAGISKYRYRKEDASRKLALSEDNLVRLRDILGELEQRVGPLKEQSRKAEKFLEYSDKKKELEISLWLYNLDIYTKSLRELENKITIAQAQYNDINSKLADFDELNEKNSRLFASLSVEIDTNRENIAKNNEECTRLQGEINLIKNNIFHVDEEFERLKNERQILNQSDSEAETLINEKNIVIEENKSLLHSVNNEISQLEDNLVKLISDNEKISGDIEKKAIELNNLGIILSDLKVKKIGCDTLIDQNNIRIDAIDETINKYNNQLSSFKEEYEQTRVFFDDLTTKLKDENNILSGYKLMLTGKEQSVNEVQDKFNNLNFDLESKKRRVQMLIDMQKNMEGYSQAVKSVINESEKGILRGIHGTVSSLIKVDKQYTIAIETALGNAIGDIVVDNESDAKRAIKFLKDNHLGRATFLPIATVLPRSFKEDDLRNIFGYIGLADKLISFDSKYVDIMSSLLGGTIVAEDIDSAVVIAKKCNYKNKVVSLDGQIVNPGGSLTGGSHIKQAGILSRDADIQNLKNECDECENLLETYGVELEQTKHEYSLTLANIDACNAVIASLNEDKIRTMSEGKRLEDLINGIDSSIKSLIDERACCQGQIVELTEKSAQFGKEISSALIDIESINLIMNNNSADRQNIQERREEISNLVTDKKLHSLEIQKDITTLNEQISQIMSLIAQRNEKITQIDTEIEKNFSQNVEYNSRIKDITSEIEAVKQKTKECDFNIASLIIKREEIESQGVNLRQSEKEQTTIRENISGELARLTERNQAINKEYDDIVAKLYDEYQLTMAEALGFSDMPDNPNEAKKNLAEIKGKIRSLGSVNVAAIEEYKEVNERYTFMSSQVADIEKSKTELIKLINSLTVQMEELFVVAFDKINENFSAVFKNLFGGGSACLVLSNPQDVLNSGIDIDVKLPGKNVPSIDGLSGGEKALVAISIYFAIMKVNPPPFCFLDEVDTALDDINVERFADYMKKNNPDVQFICVTHRRGTMEAADMLYGVTMQEKGVTKMLELDVARLEKMLEGES